MAYWIDNNQPYVSGKQVQFFADTDEDIASLPTSTHIGVKQSDTVSHQIVGKGSIALSIESGNVYMLNSRDFWVKIGGR